MTSEQELVHAIQKVLSGEAPGVVVPIGDDAAVIDPGAHHVVLTVDTLVEGVHFDPSVTQPDDLGYKAIAVNVSDIAAMGASPRHALVSLALPGDTRPAWAIELIGGMREAADGHGMSIVGGDTVRSGHVVITVTVLGRVAKGRAVTRSGASPGDAIVVTGALGAAGGAVRLLKGPGEALRSSLGTDWERELMEALNRPHARVGEGETLAQAGASAMIDVSDGFALDLSRLCEASGVGARVELGSVPVAPVVAHLEGMDPLDLALHGGEDYELVATIAPQAVEAVRKKLDDRFGTPLTVVGTITEEGLVGVSEAGERPLEPKGWDHFA